MKHIWSKFAKKGNTQFVETNYISKGVPPYTNDLSAVYLLIPCGKRMCIINVNAPSLIEMCTDL